MSKQKVQRCNIKFGPDGDIIYTDIHSGEICAYVPASGQCMISFDDDNEAIICEGCGEEIDEDCAEEEFDIVLCEACNEEEREYLSHTHIFEDDDDYGEPRSEGYNNK
jgi:hypothetical protein